MKALVNLILYTTSLLPEAVVLFKGKAIGSLLRFFNFRRIIINKNIKTAFPHLSSKEVRALRIKCYQHFGLLAIEILRQAYYKKLKTFEKVDTTDLDEKLVPVIKKGNGVCILTGHIGNWELAGVTLSQQGIENFTTVKEMKSRVGNYLLYQIRDKNGSMTVNRKNAMRAVIKQLKEGKVVTFVLDQNMNRKEAVFVDFFGKKAATMASLATIVRKTGADVIAGALYRNEDLKTFKFWFGEPIKFVENDDPKESVLENTLRYNQVLEEMIKKHPEQWIWMHKRWRTQPVK